MASPPVQAVAHVFVDDLGDLVLSSEDSHHLSRVLRLRAGEVVSVSDGRGGQLLAEWGPAGTLTVMAAPTHSPAPAPQLTVAFALTKGDHPERTVQKLTEVGVDRVVVMSTRRCVARWAPSDVGRQMARMAKVARSAAMQCRRTWLPEVDGVFTFAQVAALPQAVLAVAHGQPPGPSASVVMIGPEGGWAPEELDDVPAHMNLGPHVLRAETAAVVAGALMVALRGGVVSPTLGD